MLQGISMSALFDLPTGAVTVWTMAVLAVAVGGWLGTQVRQVLKLL